jgi:hypothetical protein
MQLQKGQKRIVLLCGIRPCLMILQGHKNSKTWGSMPRFTPHRAGMQNTSNGEKAADETYV